MAPTPSPILAHSSNPPSGRHLRRLRHQMLSFSHHPLGQSSASRTGKAKPRILDAALQPSVVLESPPPLTTTPTPSESAALAEPSAIPVGDNQLQGPNQPGNMPGNIVAAVVVVVLILGGLIGLVVGGEMVRKQARTTGEGVPPPPSRCFGRRKSEPTKKATGSPQQRTRTSPEKLPYDEKTVTPLTRPPPVLNKERHRRLSDVWPIRSFSQAPCNRRSRQEQVEHSVQHSAPVGSPQTTWSDFAPVSHFIAPPRTVLSRIPEELEDRQSQTDIAVILGVTLQRSPRPGPVVLTSHTKQPKSSHTMESFNGSKLLGTTERCGSQDCQKVGTRDEDTKSLGSSAPDMTSDGGESSRSSMASLESLGDGNDRESLKEEVYELRRAHTRSMQMNKGVLLSLSLKTLDDTVQNLGLAHGELGGGPSCLPPALGAEGAKDNVEREMSLAMLGGGFSAVNLDEFPSPPSILPMIPSFVSSF